MIARIICWVFGCDFPEYDHETRIGQRRGPTCRRCKEPAWNDAR